MQYDAETQKIMGHAVEDLQKFMANAGRDTTEASLLAWQQGYIAGVQRAIGMSNSSKVENYD